MKTNPDFDETVVELEGAHEPGERLGVQSVRRQVELVESLVLAQRHRDGARSVEREAVPGQVEHAQSPVFLRPECLIATLCSSQCEAYSLTLVKPGVKF